MFLLENIPGKHTRLLKYYAKKISRGTPIEQINYKKEFFSRIFYVNENVLIPRIDTELLVEKTSQFIEDIPQENLFYMDLGTGS